MIVFIAGARPNYAKLAPLARECVRIGADYEWIDLNQHAFSANLNEFGIPKPAYRSFDTPNHRVGSVGIYNNLQALVYTLKDLNPEFVVVLGDVTSAHVGALAAQYANVPLAHVEAGLRSPNARVENNHRLMIDHIADLNFCTDSDSKKLLDDWERARGRNYNVGNVMHDQLMWQLDRPRPVDVQLDNGYALVTLHRAELLQSCSSFNLMVGGCVDEARRKSLTPILLSHPRHPEFHPWKQIVTPATDAHSTAHLIRNASLIFTDSGGVQDEAKLLNVPTVIMRGDTERTLGSRQTLYTDPGAVDRAMEGPVSGHLHIDAAPQIIREILREARHRRPGPSKP